MCSSDIFIVLPWSIVGIASVLAAHCFKNIRVNIIFNAYLCVVCLISVWGYAFFSGGGLLGNDPAIGRMFFPCCGFLLGELLTLVVVLSYYLYNKISFNWSYNMINCYVMSIVCAVLIGLTMYSHVIVYKVSDSKYPIITAVIHVAKVQDDIFIYYPNGDGDYKKVLPNNLKRQLLDNVDMMGLGSVPQNFIYCFDLNGVFDILNGKRVYIIRDWYREEVINIARQVIKDDTIPLKDL